MIESNGFYKWLRPLDNHFYKRVPHTRWIEQFSYLDLGTATAPSAIHIFSASAIV